MGEEFDAFEGLDGSDDAGDRAQRAGGRAGFLGNIAAEHATIAAGFPRENDHRLADVAPDAAMDVGRSRLMAGVSDKKLGEETVRAVHDNVIFSEKTSSIIHIEARRMQVNTDMGIEPLKPFGGGFDFESADVGGGVRDLALKVALVEAVGINESEVADPSCGEIEGGRGAEPSESDDEDATLMEPLLPFSPQFGQGSLSAIPGKGWGGVLVFCVHFFLAKPAGEV